MSELLQLAAALRASEDHVIRHALITRRVAAVTSKDYFDLADTFINSKSVVKALAALPRSLALAIEALVSGETISGSSLSSLQNRYLVYLEEGKPKAFESVVNSLTVLRKSSRLTDFDVLPSQEVATPNAELAQNVFTTLQCIT
ncbi:MAG: hypothetical protein WCO24_00675, partial [Actinomycetes bacterium]